MNGAALAFAGGVGATMSPNTTISAALEWGNALQVTASRPPLGGRLRGMHAARGMVKGFGGGGFLETGHISRCAQPLQTTPNPIPRTVPWPKSVQDNNSHVPL